jgi:hypothetical protein
MRASLSDDGRYPRFCARAAQDEAVFADFRRSSDYRGVLEHVTREQGEAYLAELRKDRKVFGALEAFRANDEVGSPALETFEEIGAFSPSTLRYGKVVADLHGLFGSLEGLDVCEIGIGYGGQCRLIDAFSPPKSYTLVDIKPALQLAQRYLDHFPLATTVRYLTMNELPQSRFDLVISNYAFTELPRTIQEVYLKKAILKSARGYITYNQITPEDFRSLKRDEIVGLLKGAKVLPERPETYPNNCIIVWGVQPKAKKKTAPAAAASGRKPKRRA